LGFICGLFVITLYDPVSAMNNGTSGNDSSNPRHIVLLGASIGEAWNISDVPDRVETTEYTFEYVGEYAADKRRALDSILDRGLQKPDAIIIKQCAAYFPGEPEKLKAYTKSYVEACREEGVVPILATVVPVTRSFPLRIWLLSLFRGKWRYPKGTFEAIITFNDWIRDYAQTQGLAVLDLEAAVRTSETDRHLNGRYAKIDGLHINEKAYRELDEIVIPTVKNVEFQGEKGK